MLNTGPIWFGLVWLVVRGGDGDNLRRAGELPKYLNHPLGFLWGWVRSHEATEHFGRAGELTVPHEQINLPRGWVCREESGDDFGRVDK